MRKSFKRDVEFVFLKAPHNVPPPEDEEKKENSEGVDEANRNNYCLFIFYFKQNKYLLTVSKKGHIEVECLKISTHPIDDEFSVFFYLLFSLFKFIFVILL